MVRVMSNPVTHAMHIASYFWAVLILAAGAALFACLDVWREEPLSQLIAECEQQGRRWFDASCFSGLCGAAHPPARTLKAVDEGLGADGASKATPLVESTNLLQPAAALSSVRGTLLQKQNVLLVLMMTALNLSLGLYMQTIGDQNDTYFDTATAAIVDSTYQIAFPVVGMASAVLVFALLQVYEREFVRWAVVALFGALHGLLILIPNLSGQMGGAIVFGLVRTLQWGAYFHFLGNEAHYPPAYYSRVLGYNSLVIAAVSDFVPYGFAAVLAATAPESHAGLYAGVKSLTLALFLVAAGAFCVFLRRVDTPRARPDPMP